MLRWDLIEEFTETQENGEDKCYQAAATEQNSKTIACQLKIIEGYGEGDRKQGKRLGPWTNQDVDNG